jgi:hypothetical protein
MNRQKLIIAVAALIMMAAAGGLLARLKTHRALGRPGIKTSALPDSPRLQVDLPEHVLDYSSELGQVDDIAVSVLPKDTSFGRRFYKGPDGFQMELDVVLMGSDRTSIHKPQLCLRGSGLEIRSSESIKVPVKIPHPYDLPVTKLIVSPERADPSGATSGVYVYWFVADNEYTGDHWQRMWWLFRDVVTTGVLQRWAYIYCYAPCAPGQEDAVVARMKQFIAALAPEFHLGEPPQDAIATVSNPTRQN